MQKMTVNEAEWYGAECAVQDAMNGAIYRPRNWAKRENFIHFHAWMSFRNSYHQSYHETKEGLLNVETESD